MELGTTISPTLYQRLTPEALECLNAIENEATRNRLVGILQQEEFWTNLTVANMYSLLVMTGQDLTYSNFINLFK